MSLGQQETLAILALPAQNPAKQGGENVRDRQRRADMTDPGSVRFAQDAEANPLVHRLRGGPDGHETTPICLGMLGRVTAPDEPHSRGA
jgi:hypothetical protein